jgi:hypothetical protein
MGGYTLRGLHPKYGVEKRGGLLCCLMERYFGIFTYVIYIIGHEDPRIIIELFGSLIRGMPLSRSPQTAWGGNKKHISLSNQASK